MSIISAHQVENVTVGGIEQMPVSGTKFRTISIEGKQDSIRLHLFSDNENNLVIKEAEDDF